MTNYPSGRGLGHMTHTLSFIASVISLESLKLGTLKLHFIVTIVSYHLILLLSSLITIKSNKNDFLFTFRRHCICLYRFEHAASYLSKSHKLLPARRYFYSSCNSVRMSH